MEKIEILTDYERLCCMAKDIPLRDRTEFMRLTSPIEKMQFGVGGSVLHRGYLCPSLILDIVAGNISRGKIITRLMPSINPDFEYSLDQSDNLVCVKQPFYTEYIVRRDETETGALFSDADDKLSAISECRYENGRIKSYLYALYDPYIERIIELTKEEYRYTENTMVVIWSRLGDVGSGKLLQCMEYTFTVQDGCLKSYTVKDLQADRETVSGWQDRVFHVHKNRQI